MAGKQADEINLNNQEDLLLMRPNLALEDLDDDVNADVDDDAEDASKKLSSKVKALIAKKVDRAMEQGYGDMDKTQKKNLIAAIREKREKASKEDRKKEQFQDFRKKRLLGSSFVQELDNELQERPYETQKRANISGVYDPMQERREKYEDSNFERTVLSKEQKKVINKRVERLKQQQRIDDLTELDDIGELMTGKSDRLFGSKKSSAQGKKIGADKGKAGTQPQTKKSAWQKNVDEEQYDSKRRAKIRQAGKIRHKKKGRK